MSPTRVEPETIPQSASRDNRYTTRPYLSRRSKSGYIPPGVPFACCNLSANSFRSVHIAQICIECSSRHGTAPQVSNLVTSETLRLVMAGQTLTQILSFPLGFCVIPSPRAKNGGSRRSFECIFEVISQNIRVCAGRGDNELLAADVRMRQAIMRCLKFMMILRLSNGECMLQVTLGGKHIY